MYCAVARPLSYGKTFGGRKPKYTSLICWFISLLAGSPVQLLSAHPKPAIYLPIPTLASMCARNESYGMCFATTMIAGPLACAFGFYWRAYRATLLQRRVDHGDRVGGCRSAAILSPLLIIAFTGTRDVLASWAALALSAALGWLTPVVCLVVGRYATPARGPAARLGVHAAALFNYTLLVTNPLIYGLGRTAAEKSKSDTSFLHYKSRFSTIDERGIEAEKLLAAKRDGTELRKILTWTTLSPMPQKRENAVVGRSRSYRERHFGRRISNIKNQKKDISQPINAFLCDVTWPQRQSKASRLQSVAFAKSQSSFESEYVFSKMDCDSQHCILGSDVEGRAPRNFGSGNVSAAVCHESSADEIELVLEVT